jgi:hypothetical protein
MVSQRDIIEYLQKNPNKWIKAIEIKKYFKHDKSLCKQIKKIAILKNINIKMEYPGPHKDLYVFYKK